MSGTTSLPLVKRTELSPLGGNNDPLPIPSYPSFLRHGEIVKLARNDDFLVEVMIGEDERGTVGLLETIVPSNAKGGIYFDEEKALFVVDGQPIPSTHLSDMEEKLLKYLYQNVERARSLYKIAKDVWGGWVQPSTITQTVVTLRKKLNHISPRAGKRYIQSCSGNEQGYLLTRK